MSEAGKTAGTATPSESAGEDFKTAVMWHFAAQLPEMWKLEVGEVSALAVAASDLAEKEPLHMTKGPLSVPGYRDDMSGAQVVGLMVAALWVLQGEDPEKCSGLLSAFPDVPMYAGLCENARAVARNEREARRVAREEKARRDSRKKSGRPGKR